MEDPLAQWSQSLLGLARARAQKRKAVASEDFAQAGQLKKKEAALISEVEAAQKAAVAAAGGGGGSGSEEERKRLEEAKRKAVADEDFAEAGRLKKRLKALDEEAGPSEEELGRRALGAALELAKASEDAAEVARELQSSAPGAAASSPSAVARPAAGKAAVAGAGSPSSKLSLLAATSVKQEVKQETPAMSPVPGVAVDRFLAMSNQDLWQKAWEVTWQKKDSEGQAEDQKLVQAAAQKLWRCWMSDRDQMAKDRVLAEGRQRAEETKRRGLDEAAAAKGGASSPSSSAAALAAASARTTVKPEAGVSASANPYASGGSSGGSSASSGLPEELRQAQEEYWRTNRGAASDWQRAQSDADKRMRAKEGGTGESTSSRDLCALVKLRCPADQPLQFERLLAVCPPKTTVRQLIQAMAREPQEFRQNFEGSEFCVRPVNSRCTDWLPVQMNTTPPGFRSDAALPESMLKVAKQIFEERMRPLGQNAEDPLAQYLAQPGRLPPDTPLPFTDFLTKCPPGTKPMDLVRTMAKRRDVFRQDPDGSLFCVRPRTKCRDWGAVNPYQDPTALPMATAVGEEPPAKRGAAGGAMRPASELAGDY